jgi:hypothetical protein
MKKLQYAPSVELAMNFLDAEGVRRVQAWFTYLERWDEDEAVRRNSVSLPGHPGVFLLITTTDLRIFFRVDGDTITVLDIARLPAILASGGLRVNGSAAASVLSGTKTEK